MNVLMISQDATCLAKEGTVRSDTLLRHREIANRLSHFHVVVFSVGRVKHTRLHPTDTLTLHPTQSLNKLTRAPDAFRVAARVCRRHRVELVTTQDAFFTGVVGWAISRLHRIPFEVQVHADCIGNRYWINERLLNRVLNVTGRWIVKRADNVRVVSESEREKMLRLGIPGGRIWNIPGGEGINIEKFSFGDGSGVRRRLLPEGCDRMVLFVGRVTKQKRIPDLLLAAKSVVRTLRNVCFVIVGEGKELPRVRELAAKLALGDRVIFTGNVPYAEMPGYFAAADVFVLSSGYEGTARVLMESVAAGLPIVTTKVCGVSELVADGENGFVVPVGCPSVMGKKLVEVLSDVERFRQGAERQKVALTLFDRSKNFPRLMQMWSQVARQGKAA
ncbi:MAG: glycosyltransferase family 4 protein [bacterium]|nr:glycosyltransferase family 4 protein [bacterium]